MEYAQIPKAWVGQVAVCIASGTSLTDHDITYVYNMRRQNKCKVLVVNNNYLKAPWADHLHFCDKQFWLWHESVPAFKTHLIPVMTTLSNELTGEMIERGVKVLRMGAPGGLSTYSDTVSTGGNSGYQAVNIAALYGAKRIILLGYDCKPGKDKVHWFGNHPAPTDPVVFKDFLRHWETLPPVLEEQGIEIINCSRDTAIDCLPRGILEEVLQ